MLWEIVNIIEAYGFYFNTTSSAGAWIGFVSLLLLVYCVYCWLKSIVKRQNSSYIQLSDLTTDEYAAMSYIVPLIIQPAAVYAYCIIANGSYSWLKRDDTTFVVQLGTLYALLLIVIRKSTSLLYHFNLLYRNTDCTIYIIE